MTEINQLLRITNLGWDWIQLTSTGFSQVGADDYYEKQKFEGAWLLKELRNIKAPEGTMLRWKGYAHDFGTYHEIAVYMNEDDQKHWDYFNKLEELDWEDFEKQIQMEWIEKQEQAMTKQLQHDNKIFEAFQDELSATSHEENPQNKSRRS